VSASRTSNGPGTPAPNGLERENERLRARIADLEQELLEVQTRADAVVATAQERVYWLDRWHLDLNALMEKPGAAEFRAGLRGIRWLVRRARNMTRQIRAR